jgi:uncharacterized repeat protein (TIGR03803 family)
MKRTCSILLVLLLLAAPAAVRAQLTGSLQVTLSPPAAISLGAQWQVDGGAWQTSGMTLSNLSVGNHTVSFSPVGGWTTPSNEVVSVSANSTATATGLYTLAGFVSEGIDPLYLFTYGNDGAYPYAGLTQASDGYLYGTTWNGGTNGNGAIFKISTNGTFTPLYSFTNGIDGANPECVLFPASDGWLYGTASNPGISGRGTIFRISTNGAFKVLYSFTGGNDGGNPGAGLIQATDGFLYGTCLYGGNNGSGTVFRISTNGAFTPLYSFTNGIDGSIPDASLIQASDSFLYGVTGAGGTNGNGAVFQISTNGSLTPLYSFTGSIDGGYPYASLIQAGDGSLYGTTRYGGTNGDGTVFQITTNGSFTSVYSFTGGNDGAYPVAGLVQSGNGFLIGTASAGGVNGNGTVFMINTNGWHFAPLSLFTGGDDGADPNASLIQAANGNFYGTSTAGGFADNGTIFMLDPLQLAPREFAFTATAGGPIPSTNAVLINLGAASLNWSAANSPWLNFSPSNGALAPGASLPVTMSSTAAADGLPPGNYSLAPIFTNWSDGLAQSIQVNYNALLSPLVSFPGSDGADPYSPLIQAADGNLYGTTANGGNNNYGTVFRITPAGAATILYSFTGGNDGANPYAGLVQAGNGWLYGTTEYGGTNGDGAIFQISTNGSFTALYSFTGADDGGNPTAGLIQASDGNLYGTAAGGDFYGTVFRITTGGQFTLLYSFTGADDGAYPEAALFQAGDGWLYGTANQGGINGVGTIFRVSTNGVFDPLFSFNRTDGSSPAGALIQAPDGYLYGTASAGGSRNGDGSVFRISTNGVFSPIYLFTGGYDGSTPNAGLLLAKDGWLYGTATEGGNEGEGTVFRVGTNGSFTLLYSFTGGNDGANPRASLAQAGNGSLYGTASSGGNNGNGTVFQITTKGAFTPLHSFIGTVQIDPAGTLQMGGGNLYGTTEYGGAIGEGSVFQVTTNGALTTLYSFSYGSGANPETGAIQGSDGFLYGTTPNGGNYDNGTVFKLSTNSAFTSLFSFDYADGSAPEAALVQAANGWLYGTTYGGGTNGYGTVFEITTNGAFTSLYSFDYSDGDHPDAALVQAANGCLYGTTSSGGMYGEGTIFQVTTNGVFTSLYSFTGGEDGGYPEAALVQAANGDLYGTTPSGGIYGAGTVFQITTNGAFTSLYSFTGGEDGGYPEAALVQAANGDLYGTTPSGGINGFGAVFQITTGGTFTALYSFSGGEDGGEPGGGLVASPGGWLYGITQAGGANGNGDVFALPIPAVQAPLTIAFTAAPTNGVAPLPVSFTSANVDSAGNAIVSWNWSFGDGATSTEQNPSHTYTAAGTFYPALIATNIMGGMIAGSGPASITTILPAQPAIAGCSISGANLVFSGINGQSGGTYYVLMTTNVTFPLSQWKPVATNVLSVGGSFTITATNTVSPAFPHRFYILQEQ